MFKVGDKGKTRGGHDYVITYIGPGCLTYECYDAESSCDTGYTIRTADTNGSWNFGDGQWPYDLMPPERKDNAERDELAKQFMLAIYNQPEESRDPELYEDWAEWIQQIAEEAFDYADAFMAEREKRNG